MLLCPQPEAFVAAAGRPESEFLWGLKGAPSQKQRRQRPPPPAGKDRVASHCAGAAHSHRLSRPRAFGLAEGAVMSRPSWQGARASLSSTWSSGASAWRSGELGQARGPSASDLGHRGWPSGKRTKRQQESRPHEANPTPTYKPTVVTLPRFRSISGLGLGNGTQPQRELGAPFWRQKERPFLNVSLNVIFKNLMFVVQVLLLLSFQLGLMKP